VPALIRVLGGGPPVARPAAARLLAGRGEAAAEAVPALLAALGSADAEIVASAIHALGEVGPRAAAAAPRLIALLPSEDEGGGCVRTPRDYLASTALARIGAPAVPLLLEALEGAPEAITRRRLCGVLGDIAEPAQDIVRGLVNALERDGSEEVRAEAAAALGAPRLRGDDRAVTALARALNDASEHVRLRAAISLSAGGSHSEEAVRMLSALVLDSSPHRWEAAESLGAMGPRAAGGVGALRAALTSLDGMLRHEAVTALGRIGPPARSALPALRELLHLTTLAEFRDPIAEAIAAIEHGPDPGTGKD
jgi:HEAT repeat protein